MAMNDIINRLVTVTGDSEVGYGTVGDDVLGVVTKCEVAGNLSVYPLGFSILRDSGTFKLSSATVTALGLTGDYVVTVEWNGTFENVALTSTTAKKPTAKQYVIVGTNGVAEKLDDTTSKASKNALVLAVQGDKVTLKIS